MEVDGVAGLGAVGVDAVKGLLVEPDDCEGVGVGEGDGTGPGRGVAGGDDTGGTDGVDPGDDEAVAGSTVVLSVPIGKPGQRPQYSWQYALQGIN